MLERRGNAISPQARSKRDVRADRILDAAATLLQQWVYNKTTVDHIARHAGVAKGLKHFVESMQEEEERE